MKFSSDGKVQWFLERNGQIRVRVRSRLSEQCDRQIIAAVGQIVKSELERRERALGLAKVALPAGSRLRPWFVNFLARLGFGRIRIERQIVKGKK